MIFVAMVLMAAEHVVGWDNVYAGTLDFVCPSGQSLYKIKSEHSNQKEDRVFDLSCRSVPAGTLSSCTRSGEENA